VVKRIAVVAARFNQSVVGKLVEGAESHLAQESVAYDLTWVPGAFELPLTAKTLAGTGRYDAVVCLGAVIRGETSHYDFVAGEAARGIMDVGLECDLPVIFGVLTTDTLEQALDRAGGAHGNKGWDGVATALEMIGALGEVRAG
jgi:6,7-dimethyl-8-ribityllumazine synthase